LLKLQPAERLCRDVLQLRQLVQNKLRQPVECHGFGLDLPLRQLIGADLARGNGGIEAGEVLYFAWRDVDAMITAYSKETVICYVYY